MARDLGEILEFVSAVDAVAAKSLQSAAKNLTKSWCRTWPAAVFVLERLLKCSVALTQICLSVSRF